MERRRKKRTATRDVIRRANRSVGPLLAVLMVAPEEFAGRIRRSVRAGRNPRRLLKCVDDVEQALSSRGIHMRSYFAALRRELQRFVTPRPM